MAKTQPKAASAKSAAVALQSGETAVVEQTQRAVTNFELPKGLKLKKIVTVPSLAIKEPGQREILRFDSTIRISKVVDKEKKADGTPKREPAMIADVTRMDTGEQFIFIVPAVVKENLLRDYENDSFVGRTFLIQNLGKRTPTQRYNDFGIAELEAEETDE